MFDPSSRSRLTAKDLGRFPTDRLFDRIGRALCAAGCLPRKELFEAWEVARRVRRLFRGGRIVDLGGGHGLLAQILLLLDDSSASALVIDKRLPASTVAVHQVLVGAWPRLDGRVTFIDAAIEETTIAPGDLVVSIHGCGSLTDQILSMAAGAGARVAVLPCCHHVRPGHHDDTAGLDGWIDGTLAIDVVRVMTLRARGYRTWTQTIPAAITPKNRLLLGAPHEPGQPST